MATSSSSALAFFPRQYAKTRRFSLGVPRSFKVSADGSTVLFLRSDGPEDAKNSLWAIRCGEAAPSVVFDASGGSDEALTEAEKVRRERMREQGSGVVSFEASADCATAVFALGGSLYRVDTASGHVEVMAAESAAFDPMLSPQGDRVAYVSGATLRVTDGEYDAEVTGTSAEVDSTVSWGSAEFVAAEEMGRGRGFWWSPTGDRLAACRVDTASVQKWWISSPERPGSAPRQINYPAAGTANADVQLWLVDPVDGPQLEVDWRQEEFEYLADVQWGAELLCTVQTRDHRVRAVLSVDVTTGAVTEVQRATDDRWVELFPNSPTPSELGLVTVVDDPLTRRLARDGVPFSDPNINVRQLISVHEGSCLATVTTDGTDSVLALVNVAGAIETMTPTGQYTTATSAGGTTVLNIAREDGDTVHEIRWSDGSTTNLDSLGATPGFACTPSFHVVTGRTLNVALCLPDGHDGSPLPVLLDPYGGPHAQRVLRARNGYATSQWFAEQGFAVVIVDGRGTPGRGPVFEREIWGDFATKVLEDQIEAMQELARTRSELDLDRVGIRGWSFGGYLAALAVIRRPDAVHAAVAGAPVTDWRLYDTHYTERYLGHPDTYPEHYAQSGLVGDAHLLVRPLMLIHGLADDNVVAAHTLTLSQALLEAGRAHEVLPLSGVTHMTPQEQVAENLLHLQRDFLLSHLSPSHQGA